MYGVYSWYWVWIFCYGKYVCYLDLWMLFLKGEACVLETHCDDFIDVMIGQFKMIQCWHCHLPFA